MEDLLYSGRGTVNNYQVDNKWQIYLSLSVSFSRLALSWYCIYFPQMGYKDYLNHTNKLRRPCLMVFTKCPSIFANLASSWRLSGLLHACYIPPNKPNLITKPMLGQFGINLPTKRFTSSVTLFLPSCALGSFLETVTNKRQRRLKHKHEFTQKFRKRFSSAIKVTHGRQGKIFPGHCSSQADWNLPCECLPVRVKRFGGRLTP